MSNSLSPPSPNSRKQYHTPPRKYRKAERKSDRKAERRRRSYSRSLTPDDYHRKKKSKHSHRYNECVGWIFSGGKMKPFLRLYI